jgi:hypothetical protein
MRQNFMNRVCAFLLMCLICVTLMSFPIEIYDFHVPTASLSAIASSMGGLNVASHRDQFLIFSNPALLRQTRGTSYSLSLMSPAQKHEEYEKVLHAPGHLGKNALRGMSIQANKIGFGFATLASEYIGRQDSPTPPGILHRDYSLHSIAFAVADSIGKYDWGLTGKFIYGRLVYLSSEWEDDHSISFIDSQAMGYSWDLGLARKRGHISYGMTIYDITSAIYWGEAQRGKIRTRLATGMDYGFGDSSIGAGVNSRWGVKDTPYYNAYYSYRMQIGRRRDIRHESNLRLGVMSRDFKNQDNTLFCAGVGYFYKVAFLDIGLQSRGFKLNETQILLMLSLRE